jgi:cell division topological specificity factor
MTVLDFINRLLGRERPSGTMARERLQLVLAHDRSDLNPELLEQMRREILEVVQRYVEIDIESCDVSLETEDRVTALLANLPIKRTREVPLPKATAKPDSAQATDSSIGTTDSATNTGESAPVGANPATTPESGAMVPPTSSAEVSEAG